MQIQAPSEHMMWENRPVTPPENPSDQQINAKYELGEQRIVTESNREKLPIFVEAFKKPGHITLRPLFQRRRRWDQVRQSQLIESFIMNLPVPPVFLYESNYNTFEVMDGQQRITAILDFYEGRLTLKGLERWPELNGRTYSQLPSNVRAGIDRRSISSIVLLKESAPTDEEAILIKQLLFERLNTGGVKLAPQEIRNALYQNDFNRLIRRLAATDLFRDIWKIPRVTETEEAAPTPKLRANPLYQKMEDLEIVLRFFALRHVSQMRGGIQQFLSRYTIRAQSFSTGDLSVLENLFTRTLTLAHDIYGLHTFRPYNVKKAKWERSPHKAFYDSVMIALSRNLEMVDDLRERSDILIGKTQILFQNNPEGTFTGRANTPSDIQARIDLVEQMLLEP
jgi:hypothetical protein